MVESNPGIGGSSQKLIFASGKPKFDSAGFLGVVIFAAISAVALISGSASASTIIALAFLLVLVACGALLRGSRQWIAEIDLTTRRLRVCRYSFDRRRRTTVDCPLDECSALGTFEYDTDGHLSYSVYVRSKDGTRHAIPIANSTLNEATRVASQLSASTGIPRLDIYAGAIYVSPDDNTSRSGN
jgi:hypothetical protein